MIQIIWGDRRVNFPAFLKKKEFVKDKKKSFFVGHVKELNSDCTCKVLYEDGDGEDLYFYQLDLCFCQLGIAQA
jgi:hypothetical protein